MDSFDTTQETLISQYAAPQVTIPALIDSWAAATVTSMEGAFADFLSDYWDINTAEDGGLDNWGAILGVSRYITLPDSGAFFGFADSDNDFAPFGQAPFYAGGALTNTYELSDDAYRVLLLAKARVNISNSSIQALNVLCQAVFGEGAMYVNDLGDMAMQYVFNIVPTPVQLAIAESSGVLPHPTGVGVTVVQNMLNTSIAPPSVSVVEDSGTIVTGGIVATVSGGEKPYEWVWSWESGGAGITIGTPTNTSNTSTVVLTASGLTAPETVSGVLKCVVTDNASRTSTLTASISLTDATAVTVSASPTTLSATGGLPTISAGSTTATGADGFPPYTFEWYIATGGSYLDIESPYAATTGVESSGLPASTTTSGTLQCQITDSVGQTALLPTAVSVSITRVSQLTGSISPSSISVLTAASSYTTGEVTATGAGGQTPYSYEASFTAGGAGIDINTPAVDGTTLTAPSLTPSETLSGTLQYEITDYYGQTATPSIPVSISRASEPGANIAPAEATSSGPGATQTTNSLTCTPYNGVAPYTYVWTASISGGASITVLGYTTATATFQVSGMTPGVTYTGTATCTVTDNLSQTVAPTAPISVTRTDTYVGTLVAGEYTSGDTTNTGYYPPYAGSLSPTADLNGKTITDLSYFYDEDTGNYFLQLSISGASPQSYFTTLYVNGTAYSSSSASYAGGGWTWAVANPFNSGDSYTITIDY